MSDLTEIEALAEVYAQIEGNLDEYLACKKDPKLDQVEGHYMGYNAEAQVMIEMLKERGFIVAKLTDIK